MEVNSSKDSDTSLVDMPRQRQRSAPHHSHQSVLRGLTALQTVPAARQAALKHDIFGSGSFVQRMEQHCELRGHDGCVNTLGWDETGEFLVSGSDDLSLNIYRPLDPKPLVHKIPSGHTRNIFSAKFLTNSSATKIVSCCANGTTLLTDVNKFVEKSPLGDWMPSAGFSCHADMAMTYEVMPDLIDGHIFYDCADDGKINRYDTRIRTSCDCFDSDSDCDLHTFININSRINLSTSSMSVNDRLFSAFHRRGISAITQRPENPHYIAAACGDDTVRIYDSRKVSASDHRSGQVYSISPFVPSGWVIGGDGELQRGNNKERSSIGTRITSLKYDPCRTGQLLASYSRGNCYLIDPSGLVGRFEEGISGGPALRRTKHERNHDGDAKGKRRRSPSAGSDHSSATKKSPGSWSPTLPRGPSASDTSAGDRKDEAMVSVPGAGAGGEPGEAQQSGRSGHVRFRVHGEDNDHASERGGPQASDEPKGAILPTSEEQTVEEGVKKIDKEREIEASEEKPEEDDDFWMDTSDSESEASEEELSRQAVTDDKEYWMRRSYNSGRTDIVQMYSGHRNAKTMIKEANFFGPNSEFIMSGSDDGRIFFWDKKTGKILNVARGDKA
ncbi:DDB1- and CUL4-associated factor 6, partial [Gamsiella multidivaricata]